MPALEVVNGRAIHVDLAESKQARLKIDPSCGVRSGTGFNSLHEGSSLGGAVIG